MSKNKIGALALSFVFLIALVVANVAASSAQDGMGQMNAGQMDKRKLTTIQTAAADYGATKNAVEVRYLNLPWGEATFGYIENGVDPRNDGYYAARTWPIAHLRLNVPATWEGKQLAPGDYAIIITPRDQKSNRDMTLALASFKPAEDGGTFLKAGNVFVETPKDAQVISQKTIKFDKGAPVAPQLEVWVGKQGKDVEIKFHYGDRTHTEKLKLA